MNFKKHICLGKISLFLFDMDIKYSANWFSHFCRLFAIASYISYRNSSLFNMKSKQIISLAVLFSQYLNYDRRAITSIRMTVWKAEEYQEWRRQRQHRMLAAQSSFFDYGSCDGRSVRLVAVGGINHAEKPPDNVKPMFIKRNF